MANNLPWIVFRNRWGPLFTLKGRLLYKNIFYTGGLGASSFVAFPSLAYQLKYLSNRIFSFQCSNLSCFKIKNREEKYIPSSVSTFEPHFTKSKFKTFLNYFLVSFFQCLNCTELHV